MLTAIRNVLSLISTKKLPGHPDNRKFGSAYGVGLGAGLNICLTSDIRWEICSNSYIVLVVTAYFVSMRRGNLLGLGIELCHGWSLGYCDSNDTQIDFLFPKPTVLIKQTVMTCLLCHRRQKRHVVLL